MTGFIYNNNSYDVGFGSSKIEYVGNGESTLGYSMYGENIPEEPDKDKLLNWINITDNCTSPYIYVETDYNINTDNYIDFRCAPILTQNALDHSKNALMLLLTNTNKNRGVSISLQPRINNKKAGNNYLRYSITEGNSYVYYREYNTSSNTLTYNTWYNIGIQGSHLYINENLVGGSTYGTYSATISENKMKFFSYGWNDNGFEGKFSYCNIYSDNSKENLIHSYKPYLTSENTIIIKDEITKKTFEILGDLSRITYEIALS